MELPKHSRQLTTLDLAPRALGGTVVPATAGNNHHVGRFLETPVGADTEAAGGGDFVDLGEGQELDIDVTSQLGRMAEDLVGADGV